MVDADHRLICETIGFLMISSRSLLGHLKGMLLFFFSSLFIDFCKVPILSGYIISHTLVLLTLLLGFTDAEWIIIVWNLLDSRYVINGVLLAVGHCAVLILMFCRPVVPSGIGLSFFAKVHIVIIFFRIASDHLALRFLIAVKVKNSGTISLFLSTTCNSPLNHLTFQNLAIPIVRILVEVVTLHGLLELSFLLLVPAKYQTGYTETTAE